jgi:hypothetical protein
MPARHFPLLANPGLHYLDSAATGQIHRRRSTP